MIPPLRTILAATDLGDGSDAIVHSAALLAARTGAELHLLHSLDLPSRASDDVERASGFFDMLQTAKERLRAQAARTIPEGVRIASEEVIIYVAHKAIRARALDLAADLIVLGPHRGGEVGAHFLGTTADRVIRTSEVPCLLVTEPLAERVRRIGVAIDFADPSQGAIEAGLGWGLRMSAGGDEAPEIRVMYVGWPTERVDNPDLEARVIRPELERLVRRAVSCVPGAETLDVGVEVLWDNSPTEATARWAEGTVDMLVMGTHGSGGLKRALLGSVAGGIARRTPRPVLLVPPSLWCGQGYAPALDRLLIATDFSEPAAEALRWTTRDLAPAAEQVLVHVIEVPEPPAALAGRYGSRDELLRTAREGAENRLLELRSAVSGGMNGGDANLRTEVRVGRPAEEIARLAEGADLVVVGEHGRSDAKRGAWSLLGSTAERVLRSSPAPVLVVRGKPEGPPRHVLVAIDGSEPSLHALAWADFFARRFDAQLSLVQVESLIVYGHAARTERGEPTEWLSRRREWLREQVARLGRAAETASVHAAVGRPAEEIVALAKRTGTDLIAIGSRGYNLVGRVALGSVSGAVLRNAPCSVLVVGEPPQVRR